MGSDWDGTARDGADLNGADRYGADVLSGDWRAFGRPVPPRREQAVAGLVVEVPEVDRSGADGFVGAVVRVEQGRVALEDRHGRVRLFPLGRGFLIDGEPVELVLQEAAPRGRARTASGSFSATPTGAGTPRARIARASRILVEGRHDAELVEQVWGADLRLEGVVVELLDGVDNLVGVIREFRPGPERRLGVLVDHLVPGSKEQRIAHAVSDHGVLVVGHPFIDVWEAVKPARIGLDAWPRVPKGQDWKHGVCAALGWPHADQADIAAAWQRIRERVRDYRDLEPSFISRVEEMIDFVTLTP